MINYDESLKIYRDNLSVIETARHEGRQEGRKEGRLEIARKLIKEGDSIEKIARITGLSKEQIEKC